MTILGRVNFFLDTKKFAKISPILALLPNGIDQAAIFLAASLKGFKYAPLACNSTMSEIEVAVSALKPSAILIGSNLPMSRIEEISKLGIETIVLDIKTPLNWLPEKSKSYHLTKYQPGKLLITTSGSTGASKVVQLDFESLWGAARNFSKIHDCDSGTLIFWNYLPMSYLGGLFNLLLIPLAGGNATLIDDAFNATTLIKFWHVVEQFKISALWFVPTILRGLNRLSKSAKESLGGSVSRSFIGTAHVRFEEIEEFYRKFGIFPLQNYGLTETTFITSENNKLTQHTGYLRQPGSVGEVLGEVKIKLVPIAITDANFPGQFQIWVKTPYLMDGYLKDGILNPQLELDQDGYFNTGDLGFLNDEQLILTGREKDIIKRGGLLINLHEIERAALDSGTINLCAAIGIDHEFYGEAFVLVVEMENEDAEKIQQLKTYIHTRLSRNKWPQEIFIVKRLDRTISGKVSKPGVLKQILHQNSALRAPEK
jgi:acyl-CoA synthetase (AMP-forming)/AMP-acid ligase II